MTNPVPLPSEPMPDGAQTLFPGVKPVTTRERIEARIEARMAAPLTPRRPQKPLDIGLFDIAARHQRDLF